MGPQQATFSLSLGLASFKALIEESEIKKFPDNDLLRHLRLVTQDAEKCASVAQQLLNGKRQTRSGPGLSESWPLWWWTWASPPVLCLPPWNLGMGNACVLTGLPRPLSL